MKHYLHDLNAREPSSYRSRISRGITSMRVRAMIHTALHSSNSIALPGRAFSEKLHRSIAAWAREGRLQARQRGTRGAIAKRERRRFPHPEGRPAPRGTEYLAHGKEPHCLQSQ